MRIAFAGFRHGHILEVCELAASRGLQIVAACEEDPATRQELSRGGKVVITHANYDDFFREAEFDILAVGDYYGRRGELIIRALEMGRHVIADKPICTRLSELDRIAELASFKGLSVGCQLSLRDGGNYIALRQAIRDGRIGPVHTVSFSGQHPLFRPRRPSWYFTPGGQGGTLNDIAIHGIDAVGWLTGVAIESVVAARAWSTGRTTPEWFQDGAQLMLRLANRGGVMGDVSYLTPDSLGYKVPPYWRFTVHGSDGLAETSITEPEVRLFVAGAEQPERLPPAPSRKGGYMDDFLAEARQTPPTEASGALTTAQVLASSRASLLVQLAADRNLRDVPV